MTDFLYVFVWFVYWTCVAFVCVLFVWCVYWMCVAFVCLVFVWFVYSLCGLCVGEIPVDVYYVVWGERGAGVSQCFA